MLMREFLPASLDIIETAPSPRHRAVILSLLALLTAALGLSYFGYLSDYADVPAKFQATGRTKVVEPRVLGQVIEIRAVDGDRVKQGDALVLLDPANALADQAILTGQIGNRQAEIAREKTEIAAAGLDPVPTDPAIAWEAGTPAEAQARESAVLHAELSRLAASIAELRAQRAAAEAARDKFKANITAQDALIWLTAQLALMNQTLEKEGWNSKLAVLDSQQRLLRQQVTLSTLKAGLANAEAEIPVIDSQIATAREAMVTETTQARISAEHALDRLRQELTKAEQTLDDMTLRAPVAGTVHASAVTSLGQVVKPGQELLQVVPETMGLELIGYANNTTIGFIKPGQRVEIELDTFPYATYGTIPGEIVSIGADAEPADTKKNTLQQAALNGDITQTSVAQRTGNLVFPVTVKALRPSITIDGREVALAAGMAAVIDVKTEDRRAIDYILTPFLQLFSTAAHEQ
jgi:hemolysin D